MKKGQNIQKMFKCTYIFDHTYSEWLAFPFPFSLHLDREATPMIPTEGKCPLNSLKLISYYYD